MPADLLHVLVAIIVFIIIYIIIERWLIPLIPDSTIQMLLRILLVIVAVIYILRLLGVFAAL